MRVYPQRGQGDFNTGDRVVIACVSRDDKPLAELVARCPACTITGWLNDPGAANNGAAIVRIVKTGKRLVRCIDVANLRPHLAAKT